MKNTAWLASLSNLLVGLRSPEHISGAPSLAGKSPEATPVRRIDDRLDSGQLPPEPTENTALAGRQLSAHASINERSAICISLQQRDEDDDGHRPGRPWLLCAFPHWAPQPPPPPPPVAVPERRADGQASAQCARADESAVCAGRSHGIVREAAARQVAHRVRPMGQHPARMLMMAEPNGRKVAA